VLPQIAKGIGVNGFVGGIWNYISEVCVCVCVCLKRPTGTEDNDHPSVHRHLGSSLCLSLCVRVRVKRPTDTCCHQPYNLMDISTIVTFFMGFAANHYHAVRCKEK
jgi:hypothetical protein